MSYCSDCKHNMKNTAKYLELKKLQGFQYILKMRGASFTYFVFVKEIPKSHTEKSYILDMGQIFDVCDRIYQPDVSFIMVSSALMEIDYALEKIGYPPDDECPENRKWW